MATATKATQQSPRLPAFAPQSSLAAFDAVVKAGECCCEAVGELNGELTRFVAGRLAHDFDLGRAVASCNDFGQIVRLQQDWASTAVADYTTEATRLVQLCSRAGLAGWRTLAGEPALEAPVRSEAD